VSRGGEIGEIGAPKVAERRRKVSPPVSAAGIDAGTGRPWIGRMPRRFSKVSRRESSAALVSGTSGTCGTDSMASERFW
jgi:hypothetical protein